MVNVFLKIELRLFVITSTPSFHQPVYDSNLNFGKSKFLITTKPEEDQIIKKFSFLLTEKEFQHSHNNNKTRKSFSWDAELGFLLCKSIQNPFSQTKQSMYDAYLYGEYLNNRKANNFLSWKLSGQITHFECIVIVPFSIARFSTWINENIIPVFKHFFFIYMLNSITKHSWKL